MNAMKLAVGILCVLLASKTCTLAMAQDVGQPAEASVRQADPPEHGVLLPATQGENAHPIPPGDRLQPGSSVIVPGSGPAAPAPGQQPFTAPYIARSQDDGLDGCCRPFCNNPCPSIYGQVDALFMVQDPRLFRQPIVVDAATQSTTYLSTSNLDFNFDAGLQATFGMRVCDGLALEFSYFGLFPGNASAVAVSTPGGSPLTFPGGGAGNVFTDMNKVQVNYSSWLNGFEVNLPCCCGCCDECGGECRDACGCGDVRNAYGWGELRCRSFEWFAGFRYLNLSEKFDIVGQRIVLGLPEEGTYDIGTTNNLFGAQLGARLRRWGDSFGWEATAKAGIFGNASQETQSVTDFPDFPLRNASSSGVGVAFVGEINLSAIYRLTDVWNLRAGYEVMYIGGLALAPDQLDFNFATSPWGNQLHNSGGMFLQGMNVGLEARW
jgi:hypothetical protein